MAIPPCELAPSLASPSCSSSSPRAAHRNPHARSRAAPAAARRTDSASAVVRSRRAGLALHRGGRGGAAESCITGTCTPGSSGAGGGLGVGGGGFTSGGAGGGNAASGNATGGGSTAGGTAGGRAGASAGGGVAGGSAAYPTPCMAMCDPLSDRSLSPFRRTSMNGLCNQPLAGVGSRRASGALCNVPRDPRHHHPLSFRLMEDPAGPFGATSACAAPSWREGTREGGTAGDSGGRRHLPRVPSCHCGPAARGPWLC
jgi:hypothetical protein